MEAYQHVKIDHTKRASKDGHYQTNNNSIHKNNLHFDNKKIKSFVFIVIGENNYYQKK